MRYFNKWVRSLDERREERLEVNGEVDLKIYLTRADAAEVREVKGRLVNVSDGGLYIETDETDLPLGALTDLRISLEGQLADTVGLIRWLEPGKGAGIEFFYSTDEERDALRDYLRRWTAQRALG
ncbi:MAG: PilZ domain-containing protein [Planctomycetota bacterium]|jgi:hypothetical protein